MAEHNAATETRTTGGAVSAGSAGRADGGSAQNRAKGKGGGFGPYKEGPQYPEGDPSKGRDPEKDIPMYIKGPQIAMRDRRAYLVDQAIKNESANDEVNAKQVENNQRISELMFEILDPDKLRDETTEAALEELDRHTPEYVEQARKNRAEMLRAAPLRARGHTPQDAFIAGSPATPPETASSRSKDKDAK